MKRIDCILIDPFACEVRMIELPPGDVLDAYYAVLSHESMAVDCIDAARAELLAGRDAIIIDDEGLFKKPARYFWHAGYHSPLAGKGLVVGATASGASCSAATPIEEVRARVLFLEPRGDRLVPTAFPWIAPAATAEG